MAEFLAGILVMTLMLAFMSQRCVATADPTEIDYIRDARRAVRNWLKVSAVVAGLIVASFFVPL